MCRHRFVFLCHFAVPAVSKWAHTPLDRCTAALFHRSLQPTTGTATSVHNVHDLAVCSHLILSFLLNINSQEISDANYVIRFSDFISKMWQILWLFPVTSTTFGDSPERWHCLGFFMYSSHTTSLRTLQHWAEFFFFFWLEPWEFFFAHKVRSVWSSSVVVWSCPSLYVHLCLQQVECSSIKLTDSTISQVGAGRVEWVEMNVGVICDRRGAARVKETSYRMVWCYGLETVALTKRQEAELEVAELKTLQFSLGVTKNGQDKKWVSAQFSSLETKLKQQGLGTCRDGIVDRLDKRCWT